MIAGGFLSTALTIKLCACLAVYMCAAIYVVHLVTCRIPADRLARSVDKRRDSITRRSK